MTEYPFARVFVDNRILPIQRIIDVGFNSYYIAGVAEEHVYLANTTALRHMIVVNVSSLDIQSFNLFLPESQLNDSYRTVVDSPLYYLIDGAQPQILQGSTEDWAVTSSFRPGRYFTLGIPVNRNSFVFRSVNEGMQGYMLSKEIKAPYFLVDRRDVLEKQVDGFFCTDGMLMRNKQLDKIVYLYYYRNQFIVMDSSAQVDYRMRTIDPIDTAQIKLVRVKSGTVSSFAEPPLLVNRLSCTYGDWLFVNSNLLSQTDDRVWFEKGSVIDMYDLVGQEYKWSFYLPHYKGHKLSDFQVMSDCIIALYDRYVIRFAADNIKFSSHSIDQGSVDLKFPAD